MLFKPGTKAIAIAVMLGVGVAGCSDIYFDRRETVALGAGDGIRTNIATHMVDPWPAHAFNNRIAFNGQRAQAATDRYNRGKVITPVLPTAASKDYQTVQQSAAGQQSATSQSTSATPAAAVKGPGGP